MALVNGSIEIINRTAGTSDGMIVNTPDVNGLPAALTALRGLTGFEPVDPVPTEQREIGKFTYKQIDEGEFERQFSVEVVNVPIADAVWDAKTASGAAVKVLFRETRTVTPDQMDAARALAEIQAQRRASGEIDPLNPDGEQGG